MPQRPPLKITLRLIAAMALSAAMPAHAAAQDAGQANAARPMGVATHPVTTLPGMQDAAGCDDPQGQGCAADRAVVVAATPFAMTPIAGHVIQPVVPANLSPPISGVEPAAVPRQRAPAVATPPAGAGAPRAVPSVLIGEAATLVSADGGTARDLSRDRRDQLRQIDPALFRVLLDAGIFDPADGGFAARVQADLAALSCYNGRVDGDWGGQSQAALARYFAQLGQPAPKDLPGPGLFREVAAGAALRCPQLAARTPPRATEAAAAAPRDRGRATNAARSRPAEAAATAARATPARTAPAAPRTGAGAAAQTRPAVPANGAMRGAGQIDTNLLGSGVFR